MLVKKTSWSVVNNPKRQLEFINHHSWKILRSTGRVY